MADEVRVSSFREALTARGVVITLVRTEQGGVEVQRA